ncbi:MAG: hypothetical protein AAF211_02840 [Myxococcota bacterium]
MLWPMPLAYEHNLASVTASAGGVSVSQLDRDCATLELTFTPP